MKIAFFIVILVAFIVVLSATLFSGLESITEARYNTVQEARDDDLFSRGWLPDILPESTVNLLVESDLDKNASEGVFTISNSDLKSFVSLLSPTCGLPVLSGKEQDFIQEINYVGSFLGDSCWYFFCNDEGLCRYKMLYVNH